ncbi:putative cytosolic iron-sulfur protein assembly protein CIAO1 homolog [Caenorhabditis elegans]|uniref:Probable cytosolic iron-sulfur protein assembly protein CIAO1 homolog n=1 Tax=Caenorhabditis elegans TaxID=6239 RepID=CIAO1_CAEEL|nr:putative cytosolic iron-sulfur protein assembly protein CIAO1 homolog [Caenorhabditis elegans]Q9XW12.2 RecName: Full=Probable cytosolic iron-sulfur protein assembly protein CIAO1 homolog [Caenorhabditis elegans]CAA22322.2 Probable cytosolic iron-sulfur protein assembly protein CIAO1 homolog [Caenorhabditis elegans]|eukprot:NP_493247.2 Probable cytosolic iron-sulfur protein assembly protein CIAO1 homolog [Caenorhabditis elegans]
MLRQIGEFYHQGEKDDTSRVWMTCWHHGGRILASCGDDKAVRVWSLVGEPDSKMRLECRTTLDDSHTRAVRSVAFSNDGKCLVSASFDASVVVYQQEDGEFAEVNKLEGHESEVKCAVFSKSDEFLATCSRDKSVWFWQQDEDEDFSVSSILQPHTQDVKQVAWHPTEDLLVSCSYDSSIRFYRFDGEDWVTQQKIDGCHVGTVWSIAFDTEGHRLVTVGEDHCIQLFVRENIGSKSADQDTWKSVARYDVENTRWPLYSVAWNSTNDVIATGGGDCKIRLFKISSTPESPVIEHLGVVGRHELDVNHVAWNPNPKFSNLLTSASDDGTIRLWELEI